MVRKIRLTLAAVTFTLITLLFLDLTGSLHAWLGWLAKIQFWPAVLAMNVAVVAALLIVTLIFGRIYCSVICPLGIMQDLISALHGRHKRNRFSFSPERRWLRYSMLVVFLAACLAGINVIVSLLAPYSSYGRMVNSIVRPVWTAGNNLLAAAAEHVDSYAFYSVDVWMRSGITLAIAIATFVIIAVLAWRGGRTYCNTICPVGTILSFFARFSWLKISIDGNKCVSCRLCEKNCKASAIDVKTGFVDHSRCVVCGNCLEKCNKGAITYANHAKNAENKTAADTQSDSVDSSRRAFLLGTAMATTAAALAQEKKKVDGGLAVIEDKIKPERATPITPPGSLSARHMAQHCTACQLCVSACPNDVLRPSSDLSKLMQPTMSYERGYCRPECTRCSEVCPTGAIKPIKKEDKSAIQIGHAVWIKKNCIPVTDGVTCGNCARHCPVGAITMVPLHPGTDSKLTIPAVNEARCIGCGACENLCPSRPFSAIYVEGHEAHRTV